MLTSKAEAINTNHEIRRPETRDLKPETRNPRPDTQNQILEKPTASTNKIRSAKGDPKPSEIADLKPSEAVTSKSPTVAPKPSEAAAPESPRSLHEGAHAHFDADDASPRESRHGKLKGVEGGMLSARSRGVGNGGKP